MIRFATNGDVPRIVELGSESLKGGAYESFIVDKPDHTMKLALQIIHGGGKILLWEESGVITGVLGMLIVPHPFTGEITASEIIWYVEEASRKGGAGIKLLWEAERVARELGAKKLQVSAPNEKVGAIYERFAFKKIEAVYLKELT